MNPTKLQAATASIAGVQPHALVFFHYLPPDDVVSAVLIGDLSAGLCERGWKVTAYPGNRGFGDESTLHAAREIWNGVEIRRVWRPAFRQSSNAGRMLNAIWMVMRWSLLALHPRLNPDVVIVGTDPVLSILAARTWRWFKPNTRIVHWCFDLYPEAAIADGILEPRSRLVRLLHPLLKRSYAVCDLIVDIGNCMRERLKAYGSSARVATVVPWALDEQAVPSPLYQAERRAIFGAAKLGLIYSGSFGRAHGFEDILALARAMREDDARFAFSVRGNRTRELSQAVGPDDSNIYFAPSVPVEKLQVRLSAADIHLVSLKEEWTGTVVPSKFFGALAAGRPVLFSGSPDSAIARWITELNVGWVLQPGSAQEVAGELRRYASNPDARDRMNRHCHHVYTTRFSKRAGLDEWNSELCRLLGPQARGRLFAELQDKSQKQPVHATASAAGSVADATESELM